MRFQILFAAVMAAALLALSGCGSTKTTSSGDSMSGASAGVTDSAVTESPVTMIVHGMSCPLCANNIDLLLRRVPGVTDVKINLADGAVKVDVDKSNPPTYAALARAVNQSGFTLVKIDTP